MKKLLLAAALMLPACTTFPSVPPPPSAIADKAVIDEQIGITLELAHKAVRIAAKAGMAAGILKGDWAAQIAALDQQAYDYLETMNAAYRAANADNYEAAARDARAVIARMIAIVDPKSRALITHGPH